MSGIHDADPSTTSAEHPGDAHRRVCAAFTAAVEGIAADAWDGPTPVPEWRVRDIVGHLTEWLPGLLSAGSDVRLEPGPGVAVDPATTWIHHSGQVQAVLDDPQRAGARFSHPQIGDLTVAEAIDRFYTPDVFMHTWDLARATGQDEVLDPRRCEELLAGMRPMEQALRQSGQYGPAFPIASDAPAHLRLAAFIGRDPRWRP